jgi:hypothetical protein
MPVDIESLGRPEHDNRKEVGTGDEGDDKSQGEDAWCLLKAGGEHGVLGAVDFPEAEGNDEDCS